MSWQAVARKDFRDAIRWRPFRAISVFFVPLALVVAGAYGLFSEEFGVGAASPRGLVFVLADVISMFVSLTAIFICFKAIAGERQSGSIKLLLSLPHTRGEVMLGKIVGRTGVLAVPIIGSLLAGIVLGSALLGDVAPVATLVLLVVGLFFALTFVSAMIGFSAMTGSTKKAVVLTGGFDVVTELLWDVVAKTLVFVVSGFSLPPPADWPAWVYPIMLIPPTRAFTATLKAAIPGSSFAPGGMPEASTFDAVFVSPWMGLVVLVLWLVVPVAIGFRVFQRADL